MLKLIITVDQNDADYAKSVKDITEDELQILSPLFDAIKNFQSYSVKQKGLRWTHDHNYPNGEMVRNDLGEKSPRELYPDIPENTFDLFEDFFPPCEYGFHSITNIEVFHISKIDKIL